MSDMVDRFRDIRDAQKRLQAPSLRAERDAAFVVAREQGWSLDELASVTGLSRERIRQIEKRVRAESNGCS